jgi:hypothetical protein
MKIRSIMALSAVVFAASARSACAQTAGHDVTIAVSAINEMTISAPSNSLVINSATAGSAPTSATATATYAITTNDSIKKITAQINADMPTGVTLTASLAAPTGASSAGAVALSTVPQAVVTGITKLNESGLSINYVLSATLAAGVVPEGTKTVTYTIAAGS